MHSPIDSPFHDWITRAAVRAKPSLTDFDLSHQADQLGSARWFVFGKSDDMLSHPALAHLDVAERNWLSAARLVHFLDETARTEHRIVNVAAQAMAEGRLRAYLPEMLALDALKLYTDEGYHACFSAQASHALRSVFGIEADDGPNLRIKTIENLVAETRPDQRDLAWFMMGFVAETMITKGIVDTMRSTAHSALQNLLLAHLEDEWVHARYFAQAFALVWSELDADSRTYWGQRLPRIMAAFHTRDPVLHHRLLTRLGLDAATTERVLDRLTSPASLIERTRHQCANTLQIMARCAAFRDAPVRAAFVQAGLLDLDSPH